jgi:hypothetical protein
MKKGEIMITVGIVLMIIGFLTQIAILWSLGTIVLVVGLVLWLLGAAGHAVGGRRHYY